MSLDQARAGIGQCHAMLRQIKAQDEEITKGATARLEQVQARLEQLRPKAVLDEAAADEYLELTKEKGALLRALEGYELPDEMKKAHIDSYTKKNGTFVAAHEDSRPNHVPVPSGHVRLFSGSHETINKIHGGGVFGGIFASESKEVADSHGLGPSRVTHYMDVPEDLILSQHDLDYEIDYDKVAEALKSAAHWVDDDDFDRLWELVIEEEMTDDGDERILRSDDLGEASWEAQRLRGIVATKLGYKAVEMNDEHGVSYLVLPGVDIHPHLRAPDEDSRPAAEEVAEHILIEGRLRPTRNSTGVLIADTAQEVRKFYEWFGDSKVVDSEGRPLIVYHGTTADFSRFDYAARGTNTQASGAERGFFFAGSIADSDLYVEIAKERARKNYEEEPKGRIISAYLRADNPMILTPFEEANIDEEQVEELIDADPVALDYAADNGYDAVIWPHGNMNNSAYTAVVFDADQIKMV